MKNEKAGQNGMYTKKKVKENKMRKTGRDLTQ